MTLARPLASNARSASLCGGMLRRRNMDTAESSAEVGGWPRPSFRWQRWQERALNSGPRPSAEVVGWPWPAVRWQRWQGGAVDSGPRPAAEDVEDGEVSRRRRNRPWAILKSSSRLKLMLAELCEKALALTACCEVVAPPGSGSNFSGRLKSVVGAITASMRARSSGVLCSAVGPAAKAAGPTARSTQAKPAALNTVLTSVTRCRASGGACLPTRGAAITGTRPEIGRDQD